ncbi:MAG: hypothetical protein AB9917_21905 [Negativicutes bacterium]
MFEPDFNVVKTSLKESFKGDFGGENPWDELFAMHRLQVLNDTEKMLLDYNRQLWAELTRQGVIK